MKEGLITYGICFLFIIYSLISYKLIRYSRVKKLFPTILFYGFGTYLILFSLNDYVAGILRSRGYELYMSPGDLSEVHMLYAFCAAILVATVSLGIFRRYKASWTYDSIKNCISLFLIAFLFFFPKPGENRIQAG